MATLRDTNILPATPWKWYPADPGPFLSEMQQKRLSRKAWRQPAQHYHGKGAEKTVWTRRFCAETTNNWSHKVHTPWLVCSTNLPQHRSTTVQVFANTTLLKQPRLLEYHVVGPMTRCDCTCLPASAELDKTEQIVEEARELAHFCPIFWSRGLPPNDGNLQLPVTEDPFAEDAGALNIIGGHVLHRREWRH